MSIIVEHDGEEWEFPDDAAAQDYFRRKYTGLSVGNNLGENVPQKSRTMTPEEKKQHAIQAFAMEYAPKTGSEAINFRGDPSAGQRERKWLARQFKGLAAGFSLPGAGVYSSMLRSPLEMNRRLSSGEKLGLGDILGIHKKNYDRYNNTINQLKGNAPIAAGIGGIPKNITEYAIGTKILSAPFQGSKIATWATGGSLPGKFAQWLGRGAAGGAVNAAIGQQDRFDASRIPKDFAWGFAGENLVPTIKAGVGALQKGSKRLNQWLRRGGSALIDSVLPQAKKAKMKDLQKGFDLGGELYDRKFWGSRRGMEKGARQMLLENEDQLQNLLDSKKLIQRPPLPRADVYIDSPTRASTEDIIENQAKNIAKKAFSGNSPYVNPQTGFKERVIIRRPAGDVRLPSRYKPDEVIRRTSDAPLGRSIPERKIIEANLSREVPGVKPRVIGPADLRDPVQPNLVRNKAIANEMRGVLKDYEGVAGEGASRKLINEMASEVEGSPELLPSEANKLKRRIYSIRERNYESLANDPTKVAVQKAQARGIKNEIERIIPEVAPVNKELKVYGKALDALENYEAGRKGLMRMGLKDAALVGGLGGYGGATGGPTKALIYSIAGKLTGSPAVRTGLARVLKGIGEGSELVGNTGRYLIQAPGKDAVRYIPATAASFNQEGR